jgi:branched-chain amino acid transport system permease protein
VSVPTTHSSHPIPRRAHLIRRRTLTRSLGIVLLSAIVLFLLSEALSSYNDLQLANGAYYFAVLAGLTLLTGLSGQISLGHGALMAVGAYTVALLIGNEHWPALGALMAAAATTAVVGVLVGAAATRLRGPYLAGVTLAFAVGLPALAGKYPSTFGGANGLVINPPTPPSWLGQSFPLERWEAWIACAGALVVLFAIYNLMHSALGRALEAVRDDEIAASLCGLRVARLQTLAFVISAACAGLAGGLLALVLGLAAPGAFTLGLSLALLTGVVLGGLGSILGAIWGAALLVLLPIWSTDIARSFSFSTNVTNNLPLAVYGLVLILAMLLWPSGLQGAIGVLSLRVSTWVKRHMSAGATAGGVGGGGADRDGGAGREQAAAAVPHRLGDVRRRK